MKIYLAMAMFIASLFATNTQAFPITSGNWTWVGSMSLDAGWAKAGDTQTFALAPGIVKTYVANKSNHSIITGELFIGAQHSLMQPWLVQLGLAIAATSDAKLKGTIWDDALSIFNNHSYQYKISHRHIAIKAKLFYENDSCFLPWVSASVGIGYNRSYHFTNTPLIFEALPDANFSSHTKSAFTYSLGIGVDRIITENWHAGLGYEFADWGKSQLGRAAEQTLHSGLSLNHLYTNNIVVNLTYLA